MRRDTPAARAALARRRQRAAQSIRPSVSSTSTVGSTGITGMSGSTGISSSTVSSQEALSYGQPPGRAEPAHTDDRPPVSSPARRPASTAVTASKSTSANAATSSRYRSSPLSKRAMGHKSHFQHHTGSSPEKTTVTAATAATVDGTLTTADLTSAVSHREPGSLLNASLNRARYRGSSNSTAASSTADRFAATSATSAAASAASPQHRAVMELRRQNRPRRGPQSTTRYQQPIIQWPPGRKSFKILQLVLMTVNPLSLHHPERFRLA